MHTPKLVSLCCHSILWTGTRPRERWPDPSSLRYFVSPGIFGASCNTPYTKFLFFGFPPSRLPETLSNNVRVYIPTKERYDRSCNSPIDTSRHALAQFLAFLLVLVFGCEHKRGTSFQPESPTVAPSIHGQPRTAIGDDVPSSRTLAKGSDLLLGLRFVAADARPREQPEHRMGTNGLS